MRSLSGNGAQPTTVTIRGGQTVVMLGDSITVLNYYATAGGIKDRVNALLGASPATFINSGVSGNKIADIQAAVPARVTAYAPNVVIMFIGVNDVTGGTTAAAFLASYISTLSQILANNPGVKILCVTPWLYIEHWKSAPLRWDNDSTGGFDEGFTVMIAQIAQATKLLSVPMINIRDPQLVLESLNNTPENGTGIGPYTSDGLHPTVPAGLLTLCNLIMPAIVATP